MRQLQPVLWTKGVVLSPQHLQTQDRFFEDHLSFQLGSLTRWRWGLTQIDVDDTALRAGLFSLTRVSGAFPDGLVFDVPESDESIPPRPLTPYWRPDQGSMDVFLAVREFREDGKNVAPEGRDDDTRFKAAVIDQRDEVTGQNQRPLQVARKNLRLLLEGESRDGYSALPVARLRRSAAGEVSLDPGFVPPLLDLSASPALLARATRLVTVLTTLGADLSRLRRQQNVGVAHFSVSDISNFWLLYTVNSHLPLLRHLAEVRRGHPADFYEELLTLAGSLTTFVPDVHPNDFPAYNHLDLGGCFERLDTLVHELLWKARSENVVALSLDEVQPTVHAVALDDERVLTAPRIFLAVRSELAPNDTARLVPQLLKISSGERVSLLVRQALPGAPLQHTLSPPGAVPVKLDYQYFELGRSCPEWSEIVRSRNIAVHVPSEIIHAQLQLVALLPGR